MTKLLRACAVSGGNTWVSEVNAVHGIEIASAGAILSETSATHAFPSWSTVTLQFVNGTDSPLVMDRLSGPLSALICRGSSDFCSGSTGTSMPESQALLTTETIPLFASRACIASTPRLQLLKSAT